MKETLSDYEKQIKSMMHRKINSPKEEILEWVYAFFLTISITMVFTGICIIINLLS